MRRKHLLLVSHLLVQAYQHLWLVENNDIYQWFTYVNHIHHPSSRPLYVLAVIINSYKLVIVLLRRGVTLSQELHTLVGVPPSACSGRVRVAEHSVKSRLLDFNSYSRDFVSRFFVSLRMTRRRDESGREKTFLDSSKLYLASQPLAE